MKEIKKPKMIYVKWLDPCTMKDSWARADYSISIQGLECETVGWLVFEKPKTIYVATNLCRKEDFNDASSTMVIPKTCILKKKFLK